MDANQNGSLHLPQIFSGKNVLIVDPQENMRVALTQLLLRLGFYGVVTSANEIQALSNIMVGQFDLVLIDYAIENGASAFIEKAKAQLQDKAPIFVLMGDLIPHAELKQIISSGAREVLLKPFSPQMLSSRLFNALSPIATYKSQHGLSNMRITESAHSTLTTQDTKLSVLIVDDMPLNIDVASEIIENDYEVRAATSGEIALQICRSDTPPDIVLLDVMMPGLSGMEVCEQLKASADTQHIIIIFITALADTPHIVTGLEKGAVDYITKPFIPQILKARLDAHARSLLSMRLLRDQIDDMLRLQHQGNGK